MAGRVFWTLLHCVSNILGTKYWICSERKKEKKKTTFAPCRCAFRLHTDWRSTWKELLLTTAWKPFSLRADVSGKSFEVGPRPHSISTAAAPSNFAKHHFILMQPISLFCHIAASPPGSSPSTARFSSALCNDQSVSHTFLPLAPPSLISFSQQTEMVFPKCCIREHCSPSKILKAALKPLGSSFNPVA